jgi:hypothetical protein
MRQGRWVGAGLAAVALAVVLGGPAQADGSTDVSVTGPAGGVVARCPEGMHPTEWTVTDGDGNKLAADQRVETTLVSARPGEGEGIGAWIAPYDHSPPPPAAITLTVTCTC